MSDSNNTKITIDTIIDLPVEKTWKLWTAPEHIKNWYFASDDWHAPKAENDLHPEGRFLIRMQAKDGSFGFDFTGTYKTVKLNEKITYVIDDGRVVEISFIDQNSKTLITECFEAEKINPVEMQQAGWQSILNNFRKYAESIK